MFATLAAGSQTAAVRTMASDGRRFAAAATARPPIEAGHDGGDGCRAHGQDHERSRTVQGSAHERADRLRECGAPRQILPGGARDLEASQSAISGYTGEKAESRKRWFAAAGRPAKRARFEEFEVHAYALEVAAAGRGLVLGWRHLMGRHSESEALMALGDDSVETARCFVAALTPEGRQRPLERACFRFFDRTA